MIKVLDANYDIFLSVTWPPNNNHGICGHIYEIFDYYFILSQRYKTGIFIGEDFTWSEIESIITDKYNVTSREVSDIKNNTYFASRPKILKGKNILFVDGGLNRNFQHFGVKLIFDNVLAFKCSRLDTFHDLRYNNITLLQDNRVYKCTPKDINIAIDYRKKILFSKLKSAVSAEVDTALLYCTKNCRAISDEILCQMPRLYPQFKKLIAITSFPEAYTDKFKHITGISFLSAPVLDLFSKFSSYIYTPTTTMFDCSPRFIAECKHYGKDVIYYNIDEAYLNIDTGLKYRKLDIDTDISSVSLQSDDSIINIIQNVCFNT